MLRLAIIRRFYGPDGGAQRAVERILSALGSDQIEVTLVCETSPPNWSGRVIKIESKGSRTERMARFAAEALEIIKRESFDIVQAHEWIPGAQVYRLGDGLHSDWLTAKNKARYPAAFRRSADFIERSFGFHKQMLRLQQQCLKQEPSPHFICNSDMVRQSILSSYPRISSSNLHLIRNIPSCHGKPRTISDKTLGFAGSGWARKGLSLVIDSLVELPNYRLLVAGRDKNVARYVRQAEKLRVSDQIEFLGVLSEMGEFYEKISVLVHPAIYDPFPNVTMEAMAQGIPCVVTKGTGTADFDGHQGVQVVDPTGMAISRAVKSIAEQFPASSTSAHALAVEYDEKYLMKALQQTYQQVLGNHEH